MSDDKGKGESSSVVSMVRWLSDSITGGDNSRRRAKLLENLAASTMFRKLSIEQREKLADMFTEFEFNRGDVLQLQGEKQEFALVIVEGSFCRQRVVDDQLHIVGSLGYAGSSSTVGMLHLLEREPSFASVKALSGGVGYRIHASDLERFLRENPDVSRGVILSLSDEVLVQSAKHTHQTPLFMQKGHKLPAEPLPWFAVTCAAAVESFYRSGMNAMINAAITGKPRAALFPNMHVQVPVRILYINGFKGIRHVVDSNVDLDSFDHPQLVGGILATLPGLLMSPVSSMLEASNAGHMNPEPLTIRWTRGFTPRCVREVIFGVGINQLSDFYEERVPVFQDNKMLKSLAGSFCAGLVAGYLSHVPHSLSALKLLNPKQSYRELFKSYRGVWEGRVPQFESQLGQRIRPMLVNTLACVFPKGCLVRSAQISGSFIIINSAITMLKHIKVDVYDVRRRDSNSAPT
jgi:hypothetical protein